MWECIRLHKVALQGRWPSKTVAVNYRFNLQRNDAGINKQESLGAYGTADGSDPLVIHFRPSNALSNISPMMISNQIKTIKHNLSTRGLPGLVPGYPGTEFT